MNRIESISYEFFGSKQTSEVPALIEVNVGSNAEGYIELSLEGLLEPNIECTLYELVEPTVIESRWLKTGSDLYTAERVYYTYENLTNGNLRIYWMCDTGSIPDVDHGNNYCISFMINQSLTPVNVKSAVDVIIKIRNFFKDA